MKETLKKIKRQDHVTIQGLFGDLQSAIDKLPAENIKSREEIEQAIKNLEKSFKEMKAQNYPWGSYAERMQQINLLKWALNQPQEEKGYPGSTWTDKELLG